MRRIFTALLLLPVLLQSSFPAYAKENTKEPAVIANEEALVASIRAGLKNYARVIRITYRVPEHITPDGKLPEAWMEAAMAETNEADEGDYIRFHNGGYSYKTTKRTTGTRVCYTVEITPDYYTYLTKEAQVPEKVDGILASLSFDDDTTDMEKLAAIYDYVCTHVRYDKVHRKNRYYRTKSTAYAALVEGTATCQGYALALYRLLKEEGFDVRIVTGKTSGPYADTLHAWNTVTLDGVVYHLDAAWDSLLQSGEGTYAYFLLKTEELKDHSF